MMNLFSDNCMSPISVFQSRTGSATLSLSCLRPSNPLMMIIMASILFFFTLSHSVSANEQAYQESRYTQALEGFLAQVGDPQTAQGPLYYNIGNTYYKQGIYAKAYWAYKKAERYLPRDTDLYHNLILTETKLGFSPTEDTGIVLWAKRFPFLNLSEFLAITWLAITAVALLLWLGLLRRMYKVPLIISGLCVLIFGAGVAGRYYKNQLRTTGVVISERAALKAGPAQTLPTLTTLASGTQIIRIRQQEGWAEIRLDGGLIGWIAESDYWAL